MKLQFNYVTAVYYLIWFIYAWRPLSILIVCISWFSTHSSTHSTGIVLVIICTLQGLVIIFCPLLVELFSSNSTITHHHLTFFFFFSLSPFISFSPKCQPLYLLKAVSHLVSITLHYVSSSTFVVSFSVLPSQQKSLNVGALPDLCRTFFYSVSTLSLSDFSQHPALKCHQYVDDSQMFISILATPPQHHTHIPSAYLDI